MDAGFLKTAHRGQLITLCIKDDNNKLLLVTFAIVEKEDEDTYTYFLRNCMKSAVFRATFDSEDMTFFIDGHKGSPPALVSCVPHAVVHRCLQHYLKNAPAIGSVSTEFGYGALLFCYGATQRFAQHRLVAIVLNRIVLVTVQTCWDFVVYVVVV